MAPSRTRPLPTLLLTTPAFRIEHMYRGKWTPLHKHGCRSFAQAENYVRLVGTRITRIILTTTEAKDQ